MLLTLERLLNSSEPRCPIWPDKGGRCPLLTLPAHGWARKESMRYLRTDARRATHRGGWFLSTAQGTMVL